MFPHNLKVDALVCIFINEGLDHEKANFGSCYF